MSVFLGALYNPSQSAKESPDDPNGDLRKLMYSLVEHFDTLKEDVEHLKGEKSAFTSMRARASLQETVSLTCWNAWVT